MEKFPNNFHRDNFTVNPNFYSLNEEYKQKNIEN